MIAGEGTLQFRSLGLSPPLQLRSRPGSFTHSLLDMHLFHLGPRNSWLSQPQTPLSFRIVDLSFPACQPASSFLSVFLLLFDPCRIDPTGANAHYKICSQPPFTAHGEHELPSRLSHFHQVICYSVTWISSHPAATFSPAGQLRKGQLG